MTGVGHVQVILYVGDQASATDFYRAVLDAPPSLNVPGMTEFALGDQATLGLMPESGIAAIISPPLPHPATGAGVPRCELYLHVNDVNAAYARAVRAGAREISSPSWRDWGHYVGYLADPDGHVLAFATTP